LRWANIKADFRHPLVFAGLQVLQYRHLVDEPLRKDTEVI
jgi:hypothetical protein